MVMKELFKRTGLIALSLALLLAFMTALPAGQAQAEDSDKDLSKAEITVDNETYCGEESWLNPLNVTLNGQELNQNYEYYLAFEDSKGNEFADATYPVNAGKYYVVIKPWGEYTGTKKAAFTISKAPQAVKVSKTKYTKFYGDKAFSLGAKRTKGIGKLTYVSSDPKVASVSSAGKVTIKKVKKAKTVKVSVYAAETNNYKKSPVKTVSIKVYPKQKTSKAYKKYLHTWRSGKDFKLKIKVANKNFLWATMTARNGDSVTIKKMMKVKKTNTLTLKSKKGCDVTLKIRLKCGKPYNAYGGGKIIDGPEFWCTGDSNAWFQGSLRMKKGGKWVKAFQVLCRYI